MEAGSDHDSPVEGDKPANRTPALLQDMRKSKVRCCLLRGCSCAVVCAVVHAALLVSGCARDT